VRRVRTRPLSLLLRPTPPPTGVGLLVAAAFVALETLVAFPLREVAPATSLGVVYLIGVLVVSTAWGSVLGAITSVASALAFNFFHIPPTGRFTIAIGQNWVALGVFLAVALLASSVADLARARAAEAWERRREADLAAEMARLLLRTDDLRSALPAAAQRLAQALELPSAAIELEEVTADPRRVAFPLRDGTTPLGTLIVPADTPEVGLRRLQERVVPSLEALLAAAREREALLAEVVETAALRRSDVVKTALLRAVSHDLRSPLTAIVTAAGTVGSPTLDGAERDELAAVITTEARRLSRTARDRGREHGARRRNGGAAAERCVEHHWPDRPCAAPTSGGARRARRGTRARHNAQRTTSTNSSIRNRRRSRQTQRARRA